MSETKWAQLSVRLEAELVDKVRAQAKAEDRKVVKVVERALNFYLEQKGRA